MGTSGAICPLGPVLPLPTRRVALEYAPLGMRGGFVRALLAAHVLAVAPPAWSQTGATSKRPERGERAPNSNGNDNDAAIGATGVEVPSGVGNPGELDPTSRRIIEEELKRRKGGGQKAPSEAVSPERLHGLPGAEGAPAPPPQKAPAGPPRPGSQPGMHPLPLPSQEFATPQPRFDKYLPCASGAETELTSLIHPPAPSAGEEGPIARPADSHTRFQLRGKNGTVRWAASLPGRWSCMGFDPEEKNYVVVGEDELKGKRVIEGMQLITETGRRREARFQVERYRAYVILPGPSGRFTLFIGGFLHKEPKAVALYAYDAATDRIQKLGPPIAPPPFARRTGTGAAWSWGVAVDERVSEVEPKLLGFENDHTVFASYGSDGPPPAGRGKKRTRKTWDLKTLFR